MTFSHHRLISALVLSALAMSITACGGDDNEKAAPAKKATAAAKPATADSCAKSWNADANADQQATLAGTYVVDAAFEGQLRVGTWPKGAQSVGTRKGFGLTDSAKAVVSKGSCLVVLPDSGRYGQMAFAESDGKWVFVANPEGKAPPFPTAAAKAIEGARAAEPDALGRLKLNK
jgi:hypothetical protein